MRLTFENVGITAKLERAEPRNWKREELKLDYKSTDYSRAVFGLGIEIDWLLGFSENCVLSQGISTPV